MFLRFAIRRKKAISPFHCQSGTRTAPQRPTRMYALLSASSIRKMWTNAVSFPRTLFPPKSKSLCVVYLEKKSFTRVFLVWFTYSAASLILRKVKEFRAFVFGKEWFKIVIQSLCWTSCSNKQSLPKNLRRSIWAVKTFRCLGRSCYTRANS